MIVVLNKWKIKYLPALFPVSKSFGLRIKLHQTRCPTIDSNIKEADIS